MKFQSERHATLLDVQKEDFNRKEQWISKCVKFAIWVLAAFHLLKIGVAGFFILKCRLKNDCADHKDDIFDSLLICDIIITVCCFAYFFFVIFHLWRQTYAKFRFEYNKHRCFFVIFSLGMLFCLPLVLVEMIQWMISFSTLLEARFVVYLGYAAHSTPSILCAVAKPNEDCFNCFNRLAPQRYSIYQYKDADLLNLQLDLDEEKDIIRRHSTTEILINRASGKLNSSDPSVRKNRMNYTDRGSGSYSSDVG